MRTQLIAFVSLTLAVFAAQAHNDMSIQPGVVSTNGTATNEQLEAAICFEHPENELCYQEPPPPEDCEKPKARSDEFGVNWTHYSILDNDDEGGCQVSINITREPYNGVLQMRADGTFNYLPVAGYTGQESFRYNLRSNWGGGNTVTTNFVITDGELPPIDPCELNPEGDGCPCPESDEVYPNCPEPPDPNEPEPQPRECDPADVGELYLECPVTYLPKLPVVGDYTDGYCADMTPADFSVTLQDRETLRDASIRLAEISNRAGGTLVIPHDVDIIQCDDLRIGNPNRMTGPLVITGEIGPDGRRPRLYCRSANRDGTIPNQEVTGEAFYLNGDFDVLIENVHVDGYKKFMSGNGDKRVVLRNNYMHHGMSDGISNSNMEGDRRFTLEFCGNEIAHFGQGNTVHNIYMHRSLSGAGDTGLDGSSVGWNTLVIVDSVLHSAPFSDAFKSIANENIIKNNSLHSQLDTDPTYAKRYSSMLTDIPACGINYVEGNTFYTNKPVATSYGDIVVGIRNRKRTLRGCDLPQMWTPYDRPPVKIDGPGHTEKYWTALNGAIQFPTVIRGNTFISQGEFDDRKDVINMFGTYPNTEERLGGPACFLETPSTWYERSRAYVDGNTYIGHPKNKIYRNRVIAHAASCTWEQPSGPGPERDMIEVGPNETIR